MYACAHASTTKNYDYLTMRFLRYSFFSLRNILFFTRAIPLDLDRIYIIPSNLPWSLFAPLHKSKFNLKESAIKKELKLDTVYFIAFKELILNIITFISTILANKAFSHLLILKDITRPTLTTGSFIYILNISSSQYTLNIFLGIIVNIKASRKSIASYSQF